MTSRKKFWTLFFSGLAVAAMILLSAGLHQLEFFPGRPLPRRGQAEDLGIVWLPVASEGVGVFYVALFIFVQLLLPFAVIYFIISPEARKRVLRSLGFLLWILVIYFVMRARPDLFGEFEMQPLGTPSPDGTAISTVEFVAHPPQWLVFVMTLGLAVLVAAALVGAVWFVWRRSRRPASSLEQLALEAQDALEALHAGAGLKNTVMRCYFEMSHVLSKQRGIKRQKAMTPREFERYLEEAGLPGEHVRQLTRLFEGVRYGAKVTGEGGERQAVACLTAIVQACKSSP